MNDASAEIVHTVFTGARLIRVTVDSQAVLTVESATADGLGHRVGEWEKPDTLSWFRGRALLLQEFFQHFKGEL